MKVSITFSDLTQEEAQHVTNSVAGTTLTTVGALLGPGPLAAEKPKRKRRTKEEMAEARATEAVEEAIDEKVEEEKPRRRKKRGADVGPEVAEANVARGRKKRGGGTDPTSDAPQTPDQSRSQSAPTAGRQKKRTSTKTASPSDDEISDQDVSRKASEGAQHLTPKVIVDMLEEFGVAGVHELDQEQRREFVDMVDEKLDAAKEAEETE